MSDDSPKPPKPAHADDLLLLALTWATQYGWGATRVVSLFVVSTVMLGALLYAESKAAEPIIPLTFFTQPVIAVCSVAAFVLGVGMFGTIIYLPLFMQGVLGVSATQSGNLLTPLLMGVVVASIVGGQTISRTGEYKMLGVAGSVLVAIGMILFARMDAVTTRLYVATAMVVAGFGMGLLQPVYTLAVQNVAPRERMGAATSSTIFFRSIGSTVGVAAFGSVMLTRYHNEFTRTIPSVVPKIEPGSIPFRIGWPSAPGAKMPRVPSLPWAPWWSTHVSPSTCLPKPLSSALLPRS